MEINVEDLNVSRQSVSVDETRFSRLETLVEMLVQQGLEDKKKTNTLQESFADGRLNYDDELVADTNTQLPAFYRTIRPISIDVGRISKIGYHRKMRTPVRELTTKVQGN